MAHHRPHLRLRTRHPHPAVPGRPLTADPAELAAFRPPYAFLAWHLNRRGYQVSPDLLGDDQPERTAQLYAGLREWLHG
ncbi:hypothetical protein [Streptomyces albidoflavus]|uniref:hypothetical protein n=1 Tax=Streptomyces albidoflavus TaxID=1886 RepID=UPI0033C3F1AA